MALKHIFVDSPSLLATRLNAIPDDGGDYEIKLRGELFDVGITSPLGANIILDHRAGGKIVLTTHSGLPVRIQGPSSYAFDHFTITGRDIHIDGIHFGDAIPYPASLADARTIFARLGGVAFDSSYVCDPTAITLTNCTTNGRSQIVLFNSSNPATYTLARILNCRTEDVGINSAFLIEAADGVNGYFNAFVDNLRGNGKNGPDGPGANAHQAGTAGLGATRFAGSSFAEVTRMTHLAQIFGSLNHDLHCFQFHFMPSPSARVLFRDCTFEGRWESGNATGFGGGNVWLGYYHGGGPDYPIGPPRPRWDFENCSLTGYISPTVTEAPTHWAFVGGLNLFNCQSSAEYHFWDTAFSWSVPAAFAPYTSALSLLVSNTTAHYHHCSINATTSTNALSGNQVVTTDTDTRPNPGLTHGRVPGLF